MDPLLQFVLLVVLVLGGDFHRQGRCPIFTMKSGVGSSVSDRGSTSKPASISPPNARISAIAAEALVTSFWSSSFLALAFSQDTPFAWTAISFTNCSRR